MALIALVSLAALCAWLGRKMGKHANIAWNSQLGLSEHDNGIPGKIADANFPARYLLCKIGTDINHIAVVATAADEPYGVCPDAPFAAGDSAAVRQFSSHKGTQTMIANGAIASSVDIYSDGTGKVGVVPVAAGTYWRVGRVVGVPASASGDMVEVEAKLDKVIVLAEFTSVTTAAATDLPSTETLANALKADFTALRTALNASPALVKVL
jgi:hypothetical protein